MSETAEKNIGQHDATPPQPGDATMEELVEQYAGLFATGVRTPVLRRPDDVGLEYEELTFPSKDGVPLEAWFIPADSDRLLVINHPMTCNRYGFPGHLPPYDQMFGGFEVDFLPELKALHEAGYNILTYDLRNCGLSGEGNGGFSGLGLLEARDVAGSLEFVANHPKLSTMKLGLFSRCMGGNSTIMAMDFWPEAFRNVQALGLLNVVSGQTFVEQGARNVGLDPQETVEKLSEKLLQTNGMRLAEENPAPHAHAVRVPTFMAQLRRDFLIDAETDGQAIFDGLGTEDKELFWIEDSNQRFYAYNYFGQHPEKLVAFFDEKIR